MISLFKKWCIGVEAEARLHDWELDRSANEQNQRPLSSNWKSGQLFLLWLQYIRQSHWLLLLGHHLQASDIENAFFSNSLRIHFAFQRPCLYGILQNKCSTMNRCMKSRKELGKILHMLAGRLGNIFRQLANVYYQILLLQVPLWKLKQFIFIAQHKQHILHQYPVPQV